jgi:C-terminal processing protease CtpA/Prc
MLASVLVAALVHIPTPQQSAELQNGDFEKSAVGESPLGWYVPTRDFSAETVATEPREGERCVHVRHEGPQTSPFGNLMQRFDAKPWRGKPIRLRSWVRVEGKGTRAQMWLRADCEQGKMGLFDNMGDRPVLSSGWSQCEITGVVDPDAEFLNVGVILFGDGALWVDGVELAATGEALVFAAEPPRALTDAGLANLLAFAELFGYVRHFHPSDEAEAASWDDVAIRGVRAVESAASPGELAAALSACFAPVAPTVRVFPAGAKPAPVPELEQAPETGWITYWKHVGFGQKAPSAYTSQRVTVKSAAELPAEVPDPAHPYAAELAGGVACLVPLSLHATLDGTLPHAAAPAPSEPRERASGNDRATRLADVVLAWNVFQHFYPYFDVTPVDWNAELERALRSAATDDGERPFLDTLRRMVAALKDGHGGVYHASEVRASFLPLDWDWIEDRLVITAVADALGAHPARGDVVVSIDGVPVAERIAQVESLISGATPQWIRWRALNDLRMRPTDAPCVLELATYPDDKPAKCELAQSRTPFSAPDFLPPKTSELVPGVWYVDLGRTTDNDVDAIIEQLADAEAIVFDLRGYPRGMSPQVIFGHIIEEPVASAQWNFPQVLRPNREQLAFERNGEWLLQPVEPFFRGKKAFLTGGGAISYAESCMGIVEHYHLAEIVGSATAGTNGNVNPFQLPGGYSVAWTGMKVLKQDGSQHHGVGIQPTQPVTRTRKGAAEGRDEVLERALEVVGR